MTTYAAATTLAMATNIFRQIALDAFNQGQGDALSSQDNLTDAAWEQKKSKGKAQMQSALDQLAHADSLDSARNGRDGFNGLITTATSVSTQITTTMAITGGTSTDQEARSHLIGALAAVLEGLASLAPVSDWEKPAASSSGG